MKLNRFIIGVALAFALSNTAWGNLMHRYSFNDGTANDSVGTAHGTLVGGATVSGGSLILGGGGAHASMPGNIVNINTYSELTLEIWLTSSPLNTGYTMAAVLGRTFIPPEDNWRGFQYIMIQPTRAAGPAAGRMAITAQSFEAESGVNHPSQINDNIEHYIAVTVGNNLLSYYFDGSLIGSAALGANQLSSLSTNVVWLGRSVFQFDPWFVGSINEFRIWNRGLSASEIADAYGLGPNQVIPEPSTWALIGLGVLAALRYLRRGSA